MSEPHRPAGAFWWLKGRANRREYWIYVAIVFGLGFALSYVVSSASAVLTMPLMFAQIRRLHDVGRSGWWALGVTFAPLAALFLLPFMSIDAAAAISVLVELALLIWLGAVPGDHGENRFGPPPPFTAKRVLTGR